MIALATIYPATAGVSFRHRALPTEPNNLQKSALIINESGCLTEWASSHVFEIVIQNRGILLLCQKFVIHPKTAGPKGNMQHSGVVELKLRRTVE